MMVHSMGIKNVFDLSVTVGNDDITWALAPRVKINRRRIMGPNDPVNSEDIVAPVHFGTHIDAPYHMIADGATVEKMHPSLFIGRGNFIDLSYKKPAEKITPEDLEGKDIQEGDIVLFYLNWYRFRGPSEEYLYHYPGIGVEAAKYLVSKKIKGVGSDAYNIEQTDKDKLKGPFPAHIELNKVDIWVLEGLADLKPYIGRKDLTVAAFPIKLAGVSGSPARVVALEFD